MSARSPTEVYLSVNLPNPIISAAPTAILTTMPILPEQTVWHAVLSLIASTAQKQSMLVELLMDLNAWIVTLHTTPTFKVSAPHVPPLTVMHALKPAPTASTVPHALLVIG
jgi:hypothetical protein